MCKRLVLLFAILGLLGGLAACDLSKGIDAAGDAYKSLTLSDEEIQQLGRESAAQLDAANPVAKKGDAYERRLSKIDRGKSLRDNIISLFLTPSGHFYEEPANLLKQELREPSFYNDIIGAIAAGASRLNEIATKCGVESNKCAKYMNSLMALGSDAALNVSARFSPRHESDTDYDQGNAGDFARADPLAQKSARN